jgi:hypothetical protein
MRAFEVYLNGKKLCRAGVDGDGVLSAIATSVVGPGRSAFSLNVGGLISSANEHLRWVNCKLRVGDEIRLKIAESDSVDKPKERYRNDPAEVARSQKKYVRRMAKQFGWKIQIPHPK